MVVAVTGGLVVVGACVALGLLAALAVLKLDGYVRRRRWARRRAARGGYLDPAVDKENARRWIEAEQRRARIEAAGVAAEVHQLRRGAS